MTGESLEKAYTSASGIDFTFETIPLNTQGEGIDFTIPVDFENLTSQDIEGLVSMIINITPVSNVYQFLGLNEIEYKFQAQLSRND